MNIFTRDSEISSLFELKEVEIKKNFNKLEEEYRKEEVK